MRRCCFLIVSAALAFVPLQMRAALAQKPNILFILADDLGYADTGFSGSQVIRTPVLDQLARGGSILDSFYVQPVCSPTRSALLTGRYAVHTGMYNVVRPGAPWGLPLAERTLGTALRDAGYETAICGKWHLGEFQPPYQPTHRGFDHQYGMWFGAIDYFTHIRDGVFDWHRDDQPNKDEGYSTHLLAREACRLIREKKSGKPLFLYLPFNAVHAPLQVPERYKAPYAALPPQRRNYAGMVAAMDEAVGQVIAALDETGLRTNTLIIFSSDNGGPAPRRITSNAPFRAGKGTIYEGGVRVCAFVNWPGHIAANRHIGEPMHMVDWYPTLIGLAGGSTKQPLPVDGRDVWPVLTAGAKSPHDAILLSGLRGAESSAIRMGSWKLLVGPSDVIAEDEDAASKAEDRRIELYDLANDPGEKNNLAAARPDKVNELRTRLASLIAGAVPRAGSSKMVRPARKETE